MIKEIINSPYTGIPLAITLFLLGLGLFAFILGTVANYTRPDTHEMSVNQLIHLECQKLAAQANERWSYKSCVESIINADKREAQILKTI